MGGQAESWRGLIEIASRLGQRTITWEPSRRRDALDPSPEKLVSARTGRTVLALTVIMGWGLRLLV
jgi:hypothetical protein